MAWYIDGDILDLRSTEGFKTYTARELDEQRWPLCPVCGQTVAVDRINVSEFGSNATLYVLGVWRCPSLTVVE